MTTKTLMRWARATQVITAEHHPDDHGMPYGVFINGGRHTGIEIHCSTELSAVALFNSIVLHENIGIEHPALQAV
jgi:hypothetical protein